MPAIRHEHPVSSLTVKLTILHLKGVEKCVEVLKILKLNTHGTKWYVRVRLSRSGWAIKTVGRFMVLKMVMACLAVTGQNLPACSGLFR